MVSRETAFSNRVRRGVGLLGGGRDLHAKPAIRMESNEWIFAVGPESGLMLTGAGDYFASGGSPVTLRMIWPSK